MSEKPLGQSLKVTGLDRPEWPDDLAAVVYIDHYGNAMTGLRVSAFRQVQSITVSGMRLLPKRTFADAVPGEAFIYVNANGLWEIALNGGSAADRLNLQIGSEVRVETSELRIV